MRFSSFDAARGFHNSRIHAARSTADVTGDALPSRWQAQTAMQHLGQRVIETGCGTGNFTRYLTDRELVVSLDVVEECVERSRARFAAYPNLQFRFLDVQDPEFLSLKAAAAGYDCVHECAGARPRRKLWRWTICGEVLVPGGRAVFLLPAFESLYGPIDRNLGHFRRYSKSGWRASAEAAGFRVAELRYFNMIGFFGWWTNARIFRREELSEVQIEVFDRLGVPLLSRIEKWIDPPVGQSIFTVLEKI